MPKIRAISASITTQDPETGKSVRIPSVFTDISQSVVDHLLATDARIEFFNQSPASPTTTVDSDTEEE